MAKGNLILGTGSGSIGDVTMMRRNGAQVARIRLRKIKNPKSQGQAEQRMINALVAKFYSPLAGVLETSFEGLNRADSYSKFMSINMNLARANKYGAVKGTYKPFPFQVSGGLLPSPTVRNAALAINAGEETINTMGQLATAIIAAYDGLQNGDQVTVIGWSEDDNGSYMPRYTRFFLDTTSSDRIPEDLNILDNTIRYAEGEDIAAWIFSRWDGAKWARSNSFVSVNSDILDTWVTDEAYALAIASFMKGAGRVPVSDVYLNGSDE